MSKNNSVSQEEMSPEISPQGGVRRVNNVPLYVLATVVGIFLLIMILVASDRAEQQNSTEPQPLEKAGNSTVFAQAIVDGGGESGKLSIPNDGIIPAAEPLKMPVSNSVANSADIATSATMATSSAVEEAALPKLKIERPDFDAPPPPPQITPEDKDEQTRIRMAKLQQFEEAVKAKTRVQVDAPRSEASANGTMQQPRTRAEALNRIAALRQEIDASTAGDPTSAYKARLRQIQQQSAGGNIGGNVADAAPQLVNTATIGAPSAGDKYSQFAGNGTDDRWQLNSAPEAPRSPYELRAGFVVPATMISGINSDLPGQIMAQVSQNVYDTATGKWLLIPQGSRLFGAYSSDVAYGQERVLVAWQRIIFPDGKAMDIGAMPGADGAGYTGFKDKVNNHYWRLFSSAVLMSAVTAGVTMSQDQNNNSDNDRVSASQAMSQALGQQLGQVTAQLIARNMNIAPTIEIRPGYRFNIIVTKDMTFSKPYQDFDY